MATGTLAPTPILIAQDAAGAPVSGAKAYFYLAGTSTPAPVYTDVGLLIAHQVPVVANGAGRFPEIFLSPGASYKLDMTTSAGVSLSGYPADNIAAVPSSSGNLDITGTAGEALSAGQAVYESDGSGGKTAGQWYKGDSGQAYSSILPNVGMVPAAIAALASGTIRQAGQITGLGAVVIGTTYYIGASGAITATAPANNRRVLGVADTTSSIVLRDPAVPTVNVDVCQGRLTLTTGVPVPPEAGVSAATTLYYAPYRGNRVALFDGTAWSMRVFAELSIAVPATTATNYDVWMYDNAGTLALELLAWRNSGQAITGATTATPIVITSNTHGLSNGDEVYIAGVQGNTPANGTWTVANVTANTYELVGSVGSGGYTAATGYMNARVGTTKLTTQDGVYVKLTATTRRYLGTVRTTAVSGQIEDTPAKRLVWNYYNRLRRSVKVIEATASWTQVTTSTVRQAGGSVANQIATVVGVSETPIDLTLIAAGSNDTLSRTNFVSIGEDSTTVFSASAASGEWAQYVANAIASIVARLAITPVPGFHFWTWLEGNDGVGTVTWLGTNATASTRNKSGLTGTFDC